MSKADGKDKSEKSEVSEKKEEEPKVDTAVFLEEDDEFEEFPAEEWEGGSDDEDKDVWEDNWDDELESDDFAAQLKEELAKVGKGEEKMMS